MQFRAIAEICSLCARKLDKTLPETASHAITCLSRPQVRARVPSNDTARAVIVSRWPGSKLIEVESDKRIFRINLSMPAIRTSSSEDAVYTGADAVCAGILYVTCALDSPESHKRAIPRCSTVRIRLLSGENAIQLKGPSCARDLPVKRPVSRSSILTAGLLWAEAMATNSFIRRDSQ